MFSRKINHFTIIRKVNFHCMGILRISYFFCKININSSIIGAHSFSDSVKKFVKYTRNKISSESANLSYIPVVPFSISQFFFFLHPYFPLNLRHCQPISLSYPHPSYHHLSSLPLRWYPPFLSTTSLSASKPGGKRSAHSYAAAPMNNGFERSHAGYPVEYS